MAGLFLHGCSGVITHDDAPDQPAQIEDLSDEAQIAYYHLSLGEALDRGDAETALASLTHLLGLAPAPELYMQKAMLLEQAGQREKALEAARAGALEYPDDYTLHIVWAELLEQPGNSEQALSVLADFEKRYAGLTKAERAERINELNSIRQYTVYLLLNSRRFDEAESYIRAVPKAELTPTLLFYEVVLLRNQGQQRQATIKLYDLVKNHPDFTDAWLTLAADMEKAGNYKSAMRFYNKALETNPVTEIYLRMLGAQIKSGDVRGAQNQVISAPFSSEVKIQAAILFMDAGQHQAARNILLTLQKDFFAADDAALYLGMIAYDTGENVKESLQRLRDISPDARNRARMMYLKALLHIRDNDYPAALEASRNLRDEYPENKDHWAFMAELANVSKNYKLSESVTREALEQWPEDIPLMYSLAMSLSAQHKNAQAIQVFEDILLLDANHNLTINALAYTLAEEKQDLPRALSLARKALAYDPENASILDTLAWVYYRMGDYERAWANIRLCVTKGVEDAVIWDHYGDIAKALGNSKAARTGYSRALELKPDNHADIRKKLNSLN